MKKITLLLCLAFLVSACHKEKPKPISTTTDGPGIYVLNQGLWNANNSTISFYNFETGEVNADIFSAVNHRGLGDTGNDLQKYGSKMYCVVNTSEIIEVMNLKDASSVKSISLSGKSPRHICFDGGKAYVSCFDGSVVRIDTASLAVETSVTVGPNPEGLCVANGKLYVANSGGYNAPNYGTSVSVIDLASFTVTKEIEVVCNPYKLLKDGNQNLMLISKGNYANIGSCLQKISTTTDEVMKTYDFEISEMAIYEHVLLFFNYNYATMQASFQKFDLNTETIISNQFISDDTKLETPYLIDVDPDNGDIYISDSYDYTVNGDLYCFDKNGNFKFKFEVGMNPANIVFYK